MIDVMIFNLFRCEMPDNRTEIRDVEAVDHFKFGGWDSYLCLKYKMEAEEEVVYKLITSTSLIAKHFVGP